MTHALKKVGGETIFTQKLISFTNNYKETNNIELNMKFS